MAVRNVSGAEHFLSFSALPFLAGFMLASNQNKALLFQTLYKHVVKEILA